LRLDPLRLDPLRLDLDSPLTALPGVGPARARALAAAGFSSLGDLLFHVPLRYEDRSTIRPLAAVAAGETVTVRGRLGALRPIRVRRRGLTLVRGVVRDASGDLPVVWFNRPYLAAQVDPEAEYLLHGGVRETRAARAERDGAGRAPAAEGGGLELVNPSCERVDAAVHSGRVVPIYGGAGELGPAFLRRLVLAALAAVDPARQVAEPLPADLLARHGLPPLGVALAELHDPGLAAEPFDAETWNRRGSRAHRRLIYGELLDLQLALARLRARAVARPQGFTLRLDDRVRGAARAVLPFRLTAAQKRVLGEIAADLERPTPMLRLLQGDVGSGKTIVAALALVAAIENGLQGAFMAPTELLAEQHHRTLEQLLGDRYRVALVTASAPDGEAARRRLAAGEVDLAVGTHALIQQGVGFRRLGLAVIDEQHRFGVAQRMAPSPGEGGARRRAGDDRDPDPALAGARSTATWTSRCSTRSRRAAGRWHLARLATERAGAPRSTAACGRAGGGRRARLLGLPADRGQRGSGRGLARASRRGGAPLAGAVAGGPGPRPHGRRREGAGDGRRLRRRPEPRAGGDDGHRGRRRRAGGDVMVIESAERFGLAQLHQLRGRVGRSGRPSRCVAIHGRPSEEARRRLAVLRDTDRRLPHRRGGLGHARARRPPRHRASPACRPSASPTWRSTGNGWRGPARTPASWSGGSTSRPWRRCGGASRSRRSWRRDGRADEGSGEQQCTAGGGGADQPPDEGRAGLGRLAWSDDRRRVARRGAEDATSGRRPGGHP
jgi:ATP-dependent DNA helicase RecG